MAGKILDRRVVVREIIASRWFISTDEVCFLSHSLLSIRKRGFGKQSSRLIPNMERFLLDTR